MSAGLGRNRKVFKRCLKTGSDGAEGMTEVTTDTTDRNDRPVAVGGIGVWIFTE